MDGGLPGAPRWAWIVMVLGVVAIGVLSYLAMNRPPPPGFTPPEAARGTTAATSTAPSSSASQVPLAPARVLVVGDGLTTAAQGEVTWPGLVEEELTAAGRTVDVTAVATEGAGYAQADPNGITFADMAEQAGGNFDLVVFFGSRHDIAAAADVGAAAEATLAAASSASPGAGLAVIGPAWPAPSPPGYILTNRDALAAAAVPSGAAFVDPLTERWFVGVGSGLLTIDGQDVTAEGHRYLAGLIRPVIERTLPARN